jgi:hypothetical protein
MIGTKALLENSGRHQGLSAADRRPGMTGGGNVLLCVDLGMAGVLVGSRPLGHEHWTVEMEIRTIFSGFARLRRGVAVVAVAAVVGSAAPALAYVYVRHAPPPLRHEVVPPPPGPGWGWRGGYWRWGGHAYMWAPGRYVRVPHPGARWIPGHWVHHPRGWVWVGGHWT